MSLARIRHAAKRLAEDPVLRQWLIGRALGRNKPPAPFTPHHPPYLADRLPLTPETPVSALPDLIVGAPEAPLDMRLPGKTSRIDPGAAETAFDGPFADLETELGLHRFAWLDAARETADPAWVARLWGIWCDRFGTPDDGWVWHPYTAAERAINILRFARAHGLPSPRERTLSVLAAHGPAIARRLEYFGAHDTSNHLANDGRGLFLLGLWLGMPTCADMGAAILTDEAERLFGPSGMLREGSSHYQALYVERYLECAAEAAGHGHEAALDLLNVAERAQAALAALYLPGGLPLIGDISPDIPPADLLGRLPAMDGVRPPTRDVLAADGWHRLDAAGWHGLWHASPIGWSFIPGHGHQDIGAPEIHRGPTPLFVDPGRGAYGEEGDAAFYRSAAAHGGLRIDGQDPYPPNKPYYSQAFRERVCGPAPTVAVEADALSLSFNGYKRLGADAVTRRWSFAPSGLRIEDTVSGRGRHAVERALVTPAAVTVRDGAAHLDLDGARFIVRAEDGTAPRAEPVTLWEAYGEGTSGTRIVFEQTTALPWRGVLTVEVMG